MVAAADAAGARVVLAHRGRENPAVREAKRQAATGKWGPLIQIKARGKGDHRCGVVDALVLGTHELNTMLYFAEANPISCWGTVLINGAPAQRSDAMNDEMYESGPQAGDRIFAEYTFPNGIIGTYESLPIGDGSNSGHALGCDLFFQNARRHHPLQARRRNPHLPGRRHLPPGRSRCLAAAPPRRLDAPCQRHRRALLGRLAGSRIHRVQQPVHRR